MKLYVRFLVAIFTCVYFFSSTVVPVLAARSYSYDDNGNMTNDDSRCFEYNDANQLKKVKNCSNNQTIAEYVYDYNGNRIVKKEYENGTLAKTVISPDDGFEISKPASTSETYTTTYYHVNDQLIAKKDPYNNFTYHHNDHLGSSSLITDESGAVVEETKYDPWGEVIAGGTKSKFQYTGQEKDSETGLNYYNARYYDPHIRRFTQPDDMLPDPYDPQQINRYAYVRNNPIRYTDPTGHFIQQIAISALMLYYTSPQWLPVVAPYLTGAVLATPSYQQAFASITRGDVEGANHNLMQGNLIFATGASGSLQMGALAATSGLNNTAGSPQSNTKIGITQKGNTIAPKLESQWHRSTFDTVQDSMKYHLKYHGQGRSMEQYTRDASNYFNQNKNVAQKVTLEDGSPGLKIKTNRDHGGYFTPDGKIVTYWDEQKK